MATKAPPEKKPSAMEEAAEAEALTVFEQLQALGDSAQVVIYREPGRKFLETLGPDGLDEETMRDRYGGGKFSLHTRDKSNKYMKGQPVRHVVIEGAPKTFPPVPDSGTDPAAAIELARLRAELEAIKAYPGNGNGGGNSDTMLAIVTLLAPAVTAMLENALNRPLPPPPPDPIAMLDVYRKMVRDDRKENAAASGDSGLDPLIEKLGLPLVGEITQLRKLQEREQQVGKEKPAQIAAPPAKPTTLPELAAFMARWCAGPAARGTNPELRAELFMEELALQETELYASVVQLSRVDNILDHWEKMIPEIGLTREWHGLFIAEIRAIADAAESPQGDEDSGSPDPEGRRGDAGDAPGDGEAGNAGGEDQ